MWTDPEFDPSLHAFYYVRVLEIPTPRWTLIQSVKSGLPPPDIVPLLGRSAPVGTTVTELKKKGATPLGDARLKALVAAKPSGCATT